MNARYIKLCSLPACQYTPGSPVLIAAGSLLKDQQTGKVLLQIKFRSISKTEIKAVKLSVSARDAFGKELEGIDDYQYLDLSAARNSAFGHRQAISLPDATTRSVSVKCTAVLFSSGAVWHAAPDANWKPLPGQTSIAATLGKLADQYQRDTSMKSRLTPEDYEDLWFCSCGEINRASETECYACRIGKNKLFGALNLDSLKQRNYDFEKARAEEAEKLAAKQAEVRAKARILLVKTAKIAAITAAAGLLIVLIFMLSTNTLVPMFQYNHAVKLMEAGEYKEAIAAFEALAGYEDSSEMVNTARHKYKVEQLKVAAIGDSVFFGTYEQDNNKSNGGEKIEWLVLDASNGKILVISKYALASKSYHATFTDVTWESCTLRQWLNADFVDSAFSDTESAMLSGEDKVFLLTSDEAAKYFPTDAERVCQPTEYMLANGIHVDSQNGNCQFWLLHSGPAKQNAPAVLFNGMIYDTNSVLSEKAVRPAMWIDLSAAE